MSNSLDENSKALSDNNEVLSAFKGKMSVFLVAACLAFTSGCAVNKPRLSEKQSFDTNGKLVSVERELRVPSYVFLTGTQNIEKQKASLGKTLSVGTSAEQEGGATNIAADIDALARLLQSLRRPIP